MRPAIIINRWRSTAWSLTNGRIQFFVPFSYYGQGWAQFKLEEFSEAVESFSALLQKYAKHELRDDALLARAMGRRKAKDLKGTIADITEYLKTNPTQTDKSNALYERGLAESGLSDHPSAAVTFQTLLKEDPKTSLADKVLYELAWALKLQNKPVEALANFARLAEQHKASPLAAEANFHVGEDHFQKKAYAEAIKSYEVTKKQSKSDEVSRQAIYKLGFSRYQLQQYAAALSDFIELTRKKAGLLHDDGLFMKAECLFKLEKYQAALAAYTEVKTVADASETLTDEIKVRILLHGGQSAAQLNQWKQSLVMLTNIENRYADSALLPEALYEMGRARENLGQQQEALAAYEQAARKSRGEVGAQARYMMGEIYFKEKKYDLAVPHFQRVMFGFGGRQAPAKVKNWQARSGYEAARCLDVQIQAATDGPRRKKLIAAAIKFYSYVVEKHAENELAATSKKRIAQLGQLK